MEAEATQPAEAEATQPAERTTHSMGTSPMALPESAVEAEDGAVADGLTAAEVGTLGAKALRDECERRGLESKSSSTKQELKARLLAALATAPRRA